MAAFSERLKSLREESGESQKILAEMVGVSIPNYSAYERGREPRQDTLIKLAEHFHVTTDYLLGHSKVKNAEFEVLSERTGLSPKAIENLYDLWHDADDNDNYNKIQMLSCLIETAKQSRLLVNMYLYYYADPVVLPDNAMTYKKGDKATPTAKLAFLGPDGQLIDFGSLNIDRMRDTCLSLIEDDLKALREVREDG